MLIRASSNRPISQKWTNKVEKAAQILPAGLPRPLPGFVRDLNVVDPRYYPYYNRSKGFWEIICPIRDRFGEREEVKGVYGTLDYQAIHDMKRRKKIGLMLMGDMKKYRKWMKREQEKNKKYQQALSIDYLTEGYLKIYNWETDKRTKYFI